MAPDPSRAFARHVIATLAYRGAKVLRDAPSGFGDARAVIRSADGGGARPPGTAGDLAAAFPGALPAGGADPADGSRSAAQILAHLADLLDWTALLLAGGQGWREAWHASTPQTWEQEVGRFFAGLGRVDAALLAETAPVIPMERIFQGPIADAFTHLGQLAFLRRLAGAPVRGEVMILSGVAAGRLGPDQAPPEREFD